jgi:CDP-4-dehydro-6-deoxyglucose reductase
MPSRVTLRPSGHSFIIEGKDSILQGGLKSGLKLDYGCSNGACGLCGAKVVSGEVEKINHADFRFSVAEQAAGMILMCAHGAASDEVVLQTVEAGEATDIPLQKIPIKVRKLEQASADVMVMRARTPRTRRLRFLAGQYATLELDGRFGDCALASCPCDDMNLEFHIPRCPGQGFFDLVFSGLKANTTLNLEGPKGNFVLRREAGRQPVFIAGGAGFAPVKSLIEHAMSLESYQTIRLYRALSPEGGDYLENLCRSLADAMDEVIYNPFRGNDLGGLMEMVAADVDLAAADVYAAGPEELLKAAADALPGAGLAKARLYLEPLRRYPKTAGHRRTGHAIHCPQRVTNRGNMG